MIFQVGFQADPHAPSKGDMENKNTLYYGDNLKVLREHVADESVDLVYLDPPFNSNADYNVLFSEKGGENRQAYRNARAVGRAII
jgi:16S rRNA G966 N2-methylase RsmD